MEIYADLHVHIGRSKGEAVKITASRDLTLQNALNYAKKVKGLDALGIVDCGSEAVLAEITELIGAGVLKEAAGGGLITDDGLLLVLGWEVELGDVHYLIYLPTIEALTELAKTLWPRTKNPRLSTQRFAISPQELRSVAESLGGLFFPAHAFTPHKGFYGRLVDSLYEVFDSPFVAIEMGLSSSTEMIAGIRELDPTAFVANSDAHSLQKIAREFNQLEVECLSFAGIKEALEKEKVIANYGLDPRLGKYFESGCLRCGMPGETGSICSTCGGPIVAGVRPRLEELGGFGEGRNRPLYVKQIPLEMLPYIGPRTLEKLQALGTEIAVLHKLPIEQIATATNPQVAEVISQARLTGEKKLKISFGKAGYYGRVEL